VPRINLIKVTRPLLPCDTQSLQITRYSRDKSGYTVPQPKVWVQHTEEMSQYRLFRSHSAPLFLALFLLVSWFFLPVFSG